MQKIDICNMALASLGQATISDLKEENERARRVSLFYEPVRKELLRMHDWSFAKRVAKLTPIQLSEEENPSEFYKAYAYPAGALYVTNVFYKYAKNRIPFKEVYSAKQAKRCIVCPREDVWAEYTQDITDTELFTPDFAQTLSLALAADLAITLTGDTNLAQLSFQKFSLALDNARLANTTEKLSKDFQTSKFWEVR